MEDVYVVQTKKGKLNLAKKADTNLLDAITQLRTALQTKVTFITTKERKFPTKVMLCASGTINDSAREYIALELKDPRIVFMDSDDLIPRIDEVLPELWFGMDAETAPYFRFIKQSIEESNDSLMISELLPKGSTRGVATEDAFVPLHLYRFVSKPKKERGQIVKTTKFEQMPVTGILRKRERLLLILGEAGSGKSTCIKRLAYVLATKGLEANSPEDVLTPILLRAIDVSAQGGMSLVEICDAEIRRLMDSNRPSFSANDLSNGRVVIFIDALDELADDGARLSVLRLIAEFHQSYPKCQVILTSRDHGFLRDSKELAGFERYRLSPIDHKQAEKIINTVQKGKNLPVEKSRELLRRLDEVHGITLNPLLVTVFAATSDYSRQDIPANITELFKKFTEMMLGRWDASKGLTQQYQAPLKDFILTRVAFEMHRRHVNNIVITESNSIC